MYDGNFHEIIIGSSIDDISELNEFQNLFEKPHEHPILYFGLKSMLPKLETQ